MRGKDPSEGVTASALWMHLSEPCLCGVIVTGKEWAPLEITHLFHMSLRRFELCPTEMRPPCVLRGQPPRACCVIWMQMSRFGQLKPAFIS